VAGYRIWARRNLTLKSPLHIPVTASGWTLGRKEPADQARGSVLTG